MLEYINGRVVDIGMRVIILGQKNGRPKINGLAPEFCEEFALDPHMFDPLRVWPNGGRRNDIRELQLDLPAPIRIKVDFLDLAV